MNDPLPIIVESRQHRVTPNFWRDAWRRFRQDRLALAGGLIFGSLCMLALSAPLISPYDPNKINLNQQWQAPSAQHWLGTDELGRDSFTRLLWGGRVSLSIGLFVASVSVIIGVTGSLVAGYVGGWLDDGIQMLVNLIAAIPFLPLLILLGSLMRLDALSVALLIASLSWTDELRLVRGQVLAVKQREYVLAARASGVPRRRILLHHILPNVFSIVLVVVGFDVAGAILLESALSFLGLGIPPPTATWGNMLSNALTNSTRALWLVLLPGLAISLTVLAIYWLTDGLRDALDPRLR